MASAKETSESHGHAPLRAFSHVTYSSAEEAEIQDWISRAKSFSSSTVAVENRQELRELNDHLSTRTTVLGSKPSAADVVLFEQIRSMVNGWTPEQRTGEHGYHYIVRYVDFVQNAPLFDLNLPADQKVKVDVGNVVFFPKAVDPKEEKEKKKKDKAAAAVGASGEGQVRGTPKVKETDSRLISDRKDSGSTAAAGSGDSSQKSLAHRTKSEKQPKPNKQVPQKSSQPATVLSPSLIDLRVGHILKAINHPNADSLYVSTIACGDAPGTDNTSSHEEQTVRTVCSGLNGLIPLEEMQDRKVIVVCNLKPVTMRGVKSAAMVLAASPRAGEGENDDHKGPVELVTPPPDAKTGERVCFEGWEGEPEGVLNPRKKVWETIQPGFTTTEDLKVGFNVHAVPQLAAEGASEQCKGGIAKLRTQSGGLCTVTSLKMAVVR